MRIGFLIALLAGSFLTSCIHPKVKYRKRALLDPIMTQSNSMSQNLLNGEGPMGVERGGLTGGENALGSNCPTCG